MGQTSKQAQELWKALQQEILECHNELITKLQARKNLDNYYNYLKKRQSELHISGLCRSDFKVGHFGKIISFRLMFVENERIYNDLIFIPTAKSVSPRLISIDTMDTYSKHYVERLIERKKIQSVADLKEEINIRRASFPQSKFYEKHGALDISGASVAITREMIQFSEIDILDTQEGKLIHKSCLMRDQLSKRKKEVIDFILTEMDCSLVVLARRNLPIDIEEAKRSIFSTKQHLTHESLRTDILGLAGFINFEDFKGKSVLIKGLSKTLSYYEK